MMLDLPQPETRVRFGGLTAGAYEGEDLVFSDFNLYTFEYLYVLFRWVVEPQAPQSDLSLDFLFFWHDSPFCIDLWNIVKELHYLVRGPDDAHDRAEDGGEDHEVDENLHHVKEKRGDLTNTEFVLLAQLSAKDENGSHRAEDEEVGHKVEKPVPLGLLVANIVDYVVAKGEPLGLIELRCESLHRPDVRKGLLGDCRDLSLSVLDLLLRCLHVLTVSY